MGSEMCIRDRIECGLEGCNDKTHNNRPREIAVRAVLNFRGVVVGIANANQNQHGMDLHGQSDQSLPCFGPRVAFFFAEPEPWAYKQSSRFTAFVISENSSSSVVLLPLAPVSLIVQLFDAFLAFSLLFGSFLLYLQEGSAASIQVDMQIEAAARLKSTVSDLAALEISRNISFGAPRAYFAEPEPWAYKQLTHFFVFEILK